MVRMRVELVDVHCRDTEDVTGADEFYIVGAVGLAPMGKKENDDLKIRGVLTRPISINDKQTKKFGQGGGTVFDSDVPENRILQIALVAFDEDSNKDWSNHGETVTKIGAGVSTALLATSVPPAQVAGLILPVAIGVVGGIMKMDKDDELGQHLREFPVQSLPNGSHLQIWNFKKRGNWYSSWDYTVRYKIHKG
ncbi:hypothetical protein [Anabaena sp. CCY 0017]|uniref:hypothetical protein n=1 Tax=Anabaena sp. CCY 0017 TaxID=3103866 RepID=UPI0039C73441